MLDDCLSASERSRNRCNTALGNREKCVDNTLSCYKRHLRRKFLLIRTTATNRPLLHHSQFFFAFFCFNNCNNIFYCKCAFFDFLDCSFNSVRNHDLLLYKNCFLNCTDHISCLYFISNLYSRNELPFQISLKRRNFNSSFQVVSGNLHNIIQWSLDSVIDTCDQTRS